MAREYKDLVVGLDIGSHKVMAVEAEVMQDGELRVALAIEPADAAPCPSTSTTWQRTGSARAANAAIGLSFLISSIFHTRRNRHEARLQRSADAKPG